MNILFASSEAHPLIKTGGLGDVSGSLPPALKRLQQDVRLILPAYPAAKSAIRRLTRVAEITVPGTRTPVAILQGNLPGTRVPVYLVDSPTHFERAGDPYRATDGRDWQDNALRFGVFNHALVALALGRAGVDWQPDILHCNDWQTGLAPALLSREATRPATVFTIHNLSYQGLFAPSYAQDLALPGELWGAGGLEFWGHLSFIKGGIAFADRITTVSPTYAREIQTPALGHGLDGLLRHRAGALSGILNGIDCTTWDPARDPYLDQPYSADALDGKRAAKAALQAHLGLPADPEAVVLGHVGRLVEQKGVDLVLHALPAILPGRNVQFAVVGSGERALEEGLRQLARTYPAQVGLHIGYSEQTAHLIEAGADIFLMPSRFEPCGLNQMYSLRYGTPPVVRHTGGLADTVVDAGPEARARGDANGFVFGPADPHQLGATIERALTLYQDKEAWQGLQRRGMTQDFCWEHSARQYLDLYASLPQAGAEP